MLAGNGKGLCEGGAKKAETFYKHEPEQKPFWFLKLTKNKKTKWFFAAKSAKIFNARELHPRFCKTHVLVAQLKYTNKLV